MSAMRDESEKVEAQIFTVFDDQEIPYATLNNALSRLTKILDEPLAGKETFPPVKLKKEHIDFFVQKFFIYFILMFSFLSLLVEGNNAK